MASVPSVAGAGLQQPAATAMTSLASETPSSQGGSAILETKTIERKHVDVNHLSPFDVSPARRWTLLAVMSLAIALDVVNVSALFTATASIVQTVHLEAGNVIWIVGAYAMTFAAFLLFFGRVSDLYPAQWLFEGGLALLGILLLVSSFVTNQYAFLVLRALQGICGAATVPSAYHLIVHLFTDKAQQQAALTTLGLSGAVANSIGVVLGGLFELASWQWLFRFLAIIALGAAAVAFLMMPKAETAKEASTLSKLQRLDIVGVFLMMGCLLLFILGLTSATVKGWTSANFLAPFLLSLALFMLFFLWESRLPDDRAVLPTGIWRLPNLPLLAFAALAPYQFFFTAQFGLSNYWQVVTRTSPILTAARLVPMGIAGLLAGIVSQSVPGLLRRPKWTMVAGLYTAMVGTALVVLSNGGNGKDYWKFIFTGTSLGAIGTLTTYLALNVAVLQAVPVSGSGVAGALLQTAFQIGGVIGISVQAGLYSRVNYDLSEWRGSQYGFYFVIGWTGVTALLVAACFRPQRSVEALHRVASTTDAGSGAVAEREELKEGEEAV